MAEIHRDGIYTPLREGLHVDILIPRRSGLPTAILRAGIRVDAEFQAFGVEILRERLHASWPQRGVLLQLVRNRVATDPLSAGGRDGVVASLGVAARNEGLRHLLVPVSANSMRLAVHGERIPRVPRHSWRALGWSTSEGRAIDVLNDASDREKQIARRHPVCPNRWHEVDEHDGSLAGNLSQKIRPI